MSMQYDDWPERRSEIVHLPHDSEEKFVPITAKEQGERLGRFYIREAQKRQEQLLKEDEERDAALELARTIDEILARRGV